LIISWILIKSPVRFQYFILAIMPHYFFIFSTSFWENSSKSSFIETIYFRIQNTTRSRKQNHSASGTILTQFLTSWVVLNPPENQHVVRYSFILQARRFFRSSSVDRNFRSFKFTTQLLTLFPTSFPGKQLCDPRISTTVRNNCQTSSHISIWKITLWA